MTRLSATPGNARHVVASLNYAAPADEKPEVYTYQSPTGGSTRSEVARHPVNVYNGRDLIDELSLDVEGIALERLSSKVEDFYDAEAVRAIYYPEIENLVKRVVGAARVIAFDHNVRCAPMAKSGENGAAMPVKFAHNDYTERSGPQRVRDLLPDEADSLLESPFAVINVWKPIRGPVQETPLAVCDAQTIRAEELVPTDLKYPDRTGEVYSLAFSPNHRWLYFPLMQANEAMLIKCYDPETTGRARFTAHTAFTDPSSPPDASARESIEVRTLAFF